LRRLRSERRLCRERHRQRILAHEGLNSEGLWYAGLSVDVEREGTAVFRIVKDVEQKLIGEVVKVRVQNDLSVQGWQFMVGKLAHGGGRRYDLRHRTYI